MKGHFYLQYRNSDLLNVLELLPLDFDFGGVNYNIRKEDMCWSVESVDNKINSYRVIPEKTLGVDKIFRYYPDKFSVLKSELAWSGSFVDEINVGFRGRRFIFLFEA